MRQGCPINQLSHATHTSRNAIICVLLQKENKIVQAFHSKIIAPTHLHIIFFRSWKILNIRAGGVYTSDADDVNI